MRIQIARDHQAQVVRHELHGVMIIADRGELLENRRVLGVFNVILDRHQPFLAYLLEDVVEQRHQLHVTRLGVFRAFQQRGERGQGRLQHLGLVGHDECAERATADGHELGGHRRDDHVDVAAMNDVRTEDATHCDGVADDYQHLGGLLVGLRSV